MENTMTYKSYYKKNYKKSLIESGFICKKM